MHYDISLGQIIEIVSFIFSAGGMYRSTAVRLKAMEKGMEQVAGALITLARQDERIKHLEKTLD